MEAVLLFLTQTDDEFAELYLSHNRRQSRRERCSLTPYQPAKHLRESLPQEVDWRKVNAVTPVHDQVHIHPHHS